MNDIAKFILTAPIKLILISCFLVGCKKNQVHFSNVESASMEPTVSVSSSFTWKEVHGGHEFKRGDIVIIK
jgi:signal peptidase I